MARVLGLIIFALSMLALSPASRASSNPSYDAAKASCEAWVSDNYDPAYATLYSCQLSPLPYSGCSGTTISDRWFGVASPDTSKGGTGSPSCKTSFVFSGPVPPACEDLPLKTFQGGLSSVCVSGCSYAPAPDLGGTTHQRINMDGSISEIFGGAYRATGQECSGGPNANPPVSDPTPERKLCGGGSCHDVAAGKFCAVNGAGVQVCVSDKPPPGGACITGGDTTLCAGNPPPLPANPPIIDPVSQIAGQDRYADTTGGVTVNNTVNNYNTSGQTPQNGAGADDNTDPASSSSTAGPKDDGTRASGGRDCGSPPICEGSQATCMVVTQSYLLRCPPGGNALGPGESDAETTVPGLDGIGEGPGDKFIREETVLDKLDTAGLGGGGQCPAFLVLDVSSFGIHSDGQNPIWCDLLDKAGYMLMFIAAFISLRILSEK